MTIDDIEDLADLFDENGKRYSGTPISNHTAEEMLVLIKHLQSENEKAKELNGELVKFIKDNLWANEHDWNRINELIKKSEI